MKNDLIDDDLLGDDVMHIREMTRDDNAAMEQIIKRLLESVGLDIPGTAYFDPELGNLAQHYEDKTNANYWVVESEEGTVVGGVGIAPFDEEKGICELQKLYITPTSQGFGLSNKLMEVALEFAEKHFASCYLETSTKLVAANQLYVKNGFCLLDRPIDGSDHHTMDAWFLKEFE